MSSTGNRSPFKAKRYIAIAALAGLVCTGGVIGATVTQQSTVVGNNITVKEQDKTDANVTVSGAPLALSFTEGEDLGKGDRGATTFTLTNTGGKDAVIEIQNAEGLSLPGKPGETVYPVNAVLQGKISTAEGEKLIFAQKFAGKGEPATGVPITVPAHGSVDVHMNYHFGSGTSMFAAHSSTYDLKFDYINKD